MESSLLREKFTKIIPGAPGLDRVGGENQDKISLEIDEEFSSEVIGS